MIDWTTEKPLIRAACGPKGVDPAFLMAIRQAENGGPGIEFGVEPPGQYDYAGQLRMAVTTVAHRLAAFPGNPLTRDAFGRVIYSDRWISYFASIWAPIGAGNDPTGLNKNWATNATTFYLDHVAEERPLPPAPAPTSV